MPKLIRDRLNHKVHRDLSMNDNGFSVQDFHSVSSSRKMKANVRIIGLRILIDILSFGCYIIYCLVLKDCT